MSPYFGNLIDIARNGLMAGMLDLDNVSSNLANLNTTGYKQSRVNFQELLTASQLNGVQPTASQMLMSQGTLQTTESAMDLAIEGSGFLAVKTADGKTAYTRDGSLKIDASNAIVTADGRPLIWSGTLPTDCEEIVITNQGEVRTKVGGAWSVAGNIQLYNFPNPSGLESKGDNLWVEGKSSGTAKAGAAGSAGYGLLHQYSLEGSNVNLASEIAHMVRLQRAFDLASKALAKTDTMISQAIHMR